MVDVPLQLEVQEIPGHTDVSRTQLRRKTSWQSINVIYIYYLTHVQCWLPIYYAPFVLPGQIDPVLFDCL